MLLHFGYKIWKNRVKKGKFKNFHRSTGISQGIIVIQVDAVDIDTKIFYFHFQLIIRTFN